MNMKQWAALAVVIFVLSWVKNTYIFPQHHEPQTCSEYVNDCRAIAMRDHLILPVEESEYLCNKFAVGQSAEMAMNEWPKEWR